MKRFFKEYYFKSPAVTLVAALLFMITACHSDNRKDASFKNRFRSSEKRVLDSFTNYIHSISSPDFPLASFKSNSDLYQKPVYTQRIQYDNNVQLFPAILWQIYALSEKTKWKHMAENYSAVLSQDHMLEKLTEVEAIQYVYLSRYLADRNQTNKSSLLDILSQYISKNEIDKEQNCVSNTNDKVCIEQLLENQLLFFASKETGDPVYAQLAQRHSEFVFERYFRNSRSNELYYELAHCETIPNANELDALSSEDFYHLAIIFYGFTILDNQKENERYHLLCVRLAELFSSIFNDIGSEGASAKKRQELIVKKMGVLSKTLVCLALNKLHDRSENAYKETAESIFHHILDELNRPKDEKNEQYTSRLYYYLFEFIRQNTKL